MKQLRPTPENVHFGYYDARLQPVLEVNDGEELAIRTVSGLPDDPVPPEWIPPEIPAIYAQVKDRLGRHMLTGPVSVRGAQPGDVLEVEIREIHPAAQYAYNTVGPMRGMLVDEVVPHDYTIMRVDRDNLRAEVIPGVWVPVRPFFGNFGVAPPLAWGRIDSRIPRAHGGNMDNKDLQAGARVFFPVWVEGALFSAGDGHAAQGDGEVNQTAVETSMEAVLKFRVRREFRIDLPMAVTPEHLMTMAFHESLDEAARRAVRIMIRLLEEHYGLTFLQAYRLCSAAANLRVTQAVNGNRGVHVLLAHGLLSGLNRQPPFL